MASYNGMSRLRFGAGEGYDMGAAALSVSNEMLF
jgi:hypothetical protein